MIVAPDRDIRRNLCNADHSLVRSSRHVEPLQRDALDVLGLIGRDRQVLLGYDRVGAGQRSKRAANYQCGFEHASSPRLTVVDCFRLFGPCLGLARSRDMPWTNWHPQHEHGMDIAPTCNAISQARATPRGAK